MSTYQSLEIWTLEGYRDNRKYKGVRWGLIHLENGLDLYWLQRYRDARFNEIFLPTMDTFKSMKNKRLKNKLIQPILKLSNEL